ncbi:unnamed protein product (plasmid) [Mycetohabitans rhizoxinica HKI 454]|uniref:Uncharacterized protein n=1 Tax=Mycetohabitans rhizoxinica (strain DSM 19002 / CIP 109453 / HKI 454) TaxID=882378 RepID=E5AUZ9_MYCRK|nr:MULTISPECIES: hypothetical protein [Mycetohabitans]MCG1048359.1 hypothetical protein [Mycetohabitans sp. B6]CBW76923.1 unnamed protein product [Mycetohabitans rhizoxinica HKI 454]
MHNVHIIFGRNGFDRRAPSTYIGWAKIRHGNPVCIALQLPVEYRLDKFTRAIQWREIFAVGTDFHETIASVANNRYMCRCVPSMADHRGAGVGRSRMGRCIDAATSAAYWNG